MRIFFPEKTGSWMHNHLGSVQCLKGFDPLRLKRHFLPVFSVMEITLGLTARIRLLKFSQKSLKTV